MSSGKKYALEFVNQTADEIIAEVQRKYSVILERIQSYDSLIKSHDQTKEMLNTLTDKVEKFPSIIQELNESISLLVSNLKHKVNNIELRIDTIGSVIKQFETLRSEEKDFNQKIVSNINKSISDLNYSVTNNLTSHQTLEQTIKTKTITFDKQLESLKENTNKHSNEISIIKELSENNKKFINNVISDFNSKLLFITTIESKFKEFKDNLENKTLEMNNRFKFEMKEFYNRLESQNKSRENAFESFKEECKNIINNNFLDIKNFQIKFDNINKQTSLIEKKMENFSLLLKKYELDK